MEKRNTCELSKLSGQNDLLAVVLSTVTSRRRDNKFLWMVDERRRALSCHAEVNVHEKIKNQKNYITAENETYQCYYREENEHFEGNRA